MLDLLVVLWLMLKWWHLFGRVIACWCVSERKIHIRRLQCTSATTGTEFNQTENCKDSDNVVNQTVSAGNKTTPSCRHRHQIRHNAQKEECRNEDLDTNLNITKPVAAEDKSLGARSKVSKPKLQQFPQNTGYFISDRLHDTKHVSQSKSSPPKTTESSRNRKRRSKSKSPLKTLSKDVSLDTTDTLNNDGDSVHKSESIILSNGDFGATYKESVSPRKALFETGYKVRTLETVTAARTERRSINLSDFINGAYTCKTQNLQTDSNKISKSKAQKTDVDSKNNVYGTEHISHSLDSKHVTVTQNGVTTRCKVSEKLCTKSVKQVEFVAKADLRPKDLPGLIEQNQSLTSFNPDNDDNNDDNTLVEGELDTPISSEEQMAYRRSLSVDSNPNRTFVPLVDRITVYEKYMASQNQELISQRSSRHRSYEHLRGRESSPDDYQSVIRLPPGNVIVTKTSPKRSRYASSVTETSDRRRYLSGERDMHTTLNRDKYAKFSSSSRVNLTEGVIRCKIREHMSNIIGKQLYASDEDVMYTYNIDNPLHIDQNLSYKDRSREKSIVNSDATDETIANNSDAASDKLDNESVQPEGYLADGELESSGNHSVVDTNESLTNKSTKYDYTPVGSDQRTSVVNQFQSTCEIPVSESDIILPFEENFDVLPQSGSSNSIIHDLSSVCDEVAETTEDGTEGVDDSFDLSELALGSYDFSLLSLKSDGTEVSDELGGSSVPSEVEDQTSYSNVSHMFSVQNHCNMHV